MRLALLQDLCSAEHCPRIKACPTRQDKSLSVAQRRLAREGRDAFFLVGSGRTHVFPVTRSVSHQLRLRLRKDSLQTGLLLSSDLVRWMAKRKDLEIISSPGILIVSHSEILHGTYCRGKLLMSP